MFLYHKTKVIITLVTSPKLPINLYIKVRKHEATKTSFTCILLSLLSMYNEVKRTE